MEITTYAFHLPVWKKYTSFHQEAIIYLGLI